ALRQIMVRIYHHRVEPAGSDGAGSVDAGSCWDRQAGEIALPVGRNRGCFEGHLPIAFGPITDFNVAVEVASATIADRDPVVAGNVHGEVVTSAGPIHLAYIVRNASAVVVADAVAAGGVARCRHQVDTISRPTCRAAAGILGADKLNAFVAGRDEGRPRLAF